MRIIGINHDELTTRIGSRAMAGLTFQFKHCLNKRYPIGTHEDNAGGWGVSELRARMNQGGDIWNTVPVDLQGQIATVKKYYGPTYNSTSADVSISEDQLFLASYFEHAGSVWSNWSFAAWLANEGTHTNTTTAR